MTTLPETLPMPQTQPAASPNSLQIALRHWPEYLMEAACLGTFMLSACVFTVLLYHPASAAAQAIESELGRRALMGLAMGLTAVGIICSPWGKRSGAHMNPAFTLTFLALGKISRTDAFFYALFQFAGGLAGVLLAEWLIGFPIRHTAVNYAVTAPHNGAWAAAFLGEFLISAGLMAAVLIVANHAVWSRHMPYVAGMLVALWIIFESPYSGMSMNPARTLGSAWPADEWAAIWIYFAAPPLGMLAAALAYRLRRGAHAVFCAKYHHHNDERCIFRCQFDRLLAQAKETGNE